MNILESFKGSPNIRDQMKRRREINQGASNLLHAIFPLRAFAHFQHSHETKRSRSWLIRCWQGCQENFKATSSGWHREWGLPTQSGNSQISARRKVQVSHLDNGHIFDHQTLAISAAYALEVRNQAESDCEKEWNLWQSSSAEKKNIQFESPQEWEL